MKTTCVLLICVMCSAIAHGQEKAWSVNLYSGYAASLYGSGGDTYDLTKINEIPIPLVGVGIAWHFSPNWSLSAQANIWGNHQQYLGTGKRYIPICGNELFGLNEREQRRRLEIIESSQYTGVFMPAYIGINFHLGIFRAGIELGGGFRYGHSRTRYASLPDEEDVFVSLSPFYDAAVNAGIEIPISETLFGSATARLSGRYWGNVAVGVGWRF